VLVLNAVSKSLEGSGDDLLELIASGAQITSWVVLWVPIGLLVYDRWYYHRDRRIYRQMRDMDLRIVPAEDGD
jgi:hypothetical protein